MFAAKWSTHFCQKSPRAPIKIESALPPPPNPKYPPLKRGILWTWVFPAERAHFSRRPQNWRTHFRPQNYGHKFYRHEDFSDLNFSSGLFPFTPELLCSLAWNSPQNVKMIARFPGGEKKRRILSRLWLSWFLVPSSTFLKLKPLSCLILTLVEPAISNHGLETTVYRPLESTICTFTVVTDRETSTQRAINSNCRCRVVLPEERIFREKLKGNN